MRVSWIIRGDIAQRTGGYIYDRLVVEGLRAHGDEVEVIGLGHAPAMSDVERDSLLARITRARAQVVVGDGLCARELSPAFEQLARRTPRLLLVHHLTSWELERSGLEALRPLEARVVHASDWLVATGQATAARLKAEYPERGVDVVPPGADRLPRYPRKTRQDAAFELLFVGSLIARKRVSVLLDALEGLADPRLSLTLLGDAAREPEYARTIARRVNASPPLRSAIESLGMVGDDAVALQMARADALVLPSSLEGYGMVVTEALRAGLPVLVSREAARAAGVEGHGAVLVFDDAAGLVGAIGRLLQDASLHRAMRRAAEDTRLPRWDQTVASFRAIIERAVSAPAGLHAADGAPDRVRGQR